MRLVCVSASRVPSDTANSIQVMKVCQALTQAGGEIVLLVPGVQPDGLQPPALQSHYGLQTLFNIEWLPVRDRRLFPWAAVGRARRLGADLLYAWPLQAAALGLLAGIPSMLEMHDFPTGRFGPLWFRLFLSLPGRKRLLPITDALRRPLESAYGRPRGGDTVIAPNGVDLERFASLPDPETARRQLGLPASPLVACTGHLYTGRGADLFLDLAGAFPQAHFLWVGGRSQHVENWQERTRALGLGNVTWAGFVPNQRLPLHQAAADVLLMPYGRDIAISSGVGRSAEVASPMKMFEYMAAGRAIITSDLPVLREVLDDSTAIFCPPDDAGAWRAALAGLLADPERRQALGRNARSAARQYDWVERARRALEGFGV